MENLTFVKTLTANDTGQSGAHQAGIHVPKSALELIGLLPPLDPKKKNPDAWIECRDEHGNIWSFRFVYYNNKLHDAGGTRNEYRVTHMTKYLKSVGALAGDYFQISGAVGQSKFKISLIRASDEKTPDGEVIIVLKGWRRVH